MQDRVLGPKAYETCIIQVFRKHFYLFIDLLRLCIIYFQSWKVKEGQYLQPRPNSCQGGFKNLKKYGHLKFTFWPHWPAIQGCNSKLSLVKLQFLSTYSLILLDSLSFSPALLALLERGIAQRIVNPYGPTD